MVSATAAAVALSGGGAAAAAGGSGLTVPGRATASMSARKAAWLASTGAGKAAAGIRSILTAHQGEEIGARGRGLGARAVALGVEAPTYGREHAPLHGVAIGFALPERVADRGQARLFLIASEDVGDAHLARRDLHRRARHARFAEIEGSAVAADSPPQHDQSGFRRPQLHVVDGIHHRAKSLLDFVGASLRQHRHGAAT